MLFRFTILLHLLICCSATAALWTSGHGDISLRY
jgi:hypothetical protein